MSGGRDSLALLLLAYAALGDRCVAATVDHGLRPESGDEAAQVAAVCREMGVTHRTHRAELGSRGNRSAAARKARYLLLSKARTELGAAFVATAHHADDQLETMLMRLNRGSGVAGLAGIRRVNGTVVRPLLGWRSAELGQIVSACGVTPVDDPSNHDLRYDRARLRGQLAEADWLDPISASRSADALAEAETAIAWAVDRAAVALKTEGGTVLLELGTIAGAWPPHEIVRRLVARAVALVDPTCVPRERTLSRLIATLEAGGSMNLGNVIARSEQAIWSFRPALPRHPSRR